MASEPVAEVSRSDSSASDVLAQSICDGRFQLLKARLLVTARLKKGAVLSRLLRRRSYLPEVERIEQVQEGGRGKSVIFHDSQSGLRLGPIVWKKGTVVGESGGGGDVGLDENEGSAAYEDGDDEEEVDVRNRRATRTFQAGQGAAFAQAAWTNEWAERDMSTADDGGVDTHGSVAERALAVAVGITAGTRGMSCGTAVAAASCSRATRQWTTLWAKRYLARAHGLPTADVPYLMNSRPSMSWLQRALTLRVVRTSSIDEDYLHIGGLGKGSYGTVTLVQSKHAHVRVAIKTLQKGTVVSNGHESHVYWEADLGRSLDHPNILKCLHVAQTQFAIHLVLEHAPGGDLFGLLCTHQYLKPRHCAFYGAQMLSALRYLGDLGVVYRDLKLENVLLDGAGNVLLSDFGLASRKAAGDTSVMYVGTAEYAAPEIVRLQPYTAAVDMWCFGIVMYELSMGRPPFLGSYESIVQQMEELRADGHTVVPYQPLRQDRRYHNDLAALIESCLTFDEAARATPRTAQASPFFRRFADDEPHRLEPSHPMRRAPHPPAAPHGPARDWDSAKYAPFVADPLRAQGAMPEFRCDFAEL